MAKNKRRKKIEFLEPKKNAPKQITKLARAKTELATSNKINRSPRTSSRLSEPSDSERTSTSTQVSKKNKVKALKKLRRHIDIENFDPLPEQGKRLLRNN